MEIIQGPLAGVSCAPFRVLTWRYSQPLYCCTEMISCKTLIHQPLYAQQRFIKKDTREKKLCYQLSANNTDELALATKLVTDHGADLIDLNCGCPKTKIRKKGSGSALLKNPSELFKLIQAMKQNTSVPVSVKIRVDGRSQEKNNLELAKMLNESGVDSVIVHGRHWSEQYDLPCYYEDIGFFANELSMPVIGNGDIACLDSLKKMMSTGCSAMMIGRAGVGQPWLIAQLQAQLRGEEYKIPTNNEIADIFIEHIDGLIELMRHEKMAILQARKFAKYYARRIERRTELCDAINRCENFIDFKMIIANFFIDP